MYNTVYNIAMCLMVLTIKFCALFKKKMYHRKKGSKQIWQKLSIADKTAKYIWVHVASFGEFEQGRPVIETIKEKNPEAKILLTFFSPSGYEICKNYPLADIVCYLPIDTPRNARRFVNAIQIEKAIFVKYEFWRNILSELKKREIPTYLISSTFRKNQLFFSPCGISHRKVLNCFTHIFVQNESSKNLLQKINIHDVTISGDTRFDRVVKIAQNAKQFPLIRIFAESQNVLVAGSTWEKDEKIIIKHFNKNHSQKLIIAPHEISKHRLEVLCSKIKRPYVKYSEATEENVTQADCLVIDGFGLLSSIYQYGSLAYIGGGFGVGIHNTLEAAVWKIPIIFGPNYQKAEEAKDLIACGGAISVTNQEEYKKALTQLLNEKNAGEQAGIYVQQHAGSTDLIMNLIFRD
ncbi:MAG: 3-deoxy-D-manno-octulosonic acid transferase [Paludibacteraceae bacterium]|nr:3-deoxy-D-manno-octulosonic acid transferase [Paludibacteraceae bacterium]